MPTTSISASAAAAPIGESIELREGGVRQGGEEPEQPEERRNGPARAEDEAAEHDGKGETRDLRGDRSDLRMNPSNEERQRRRKDQQDPGRREQRAPLEIEVDGQRIGEGNGEGGQR